MIVRKNAVRIGTLSGGLAVLVAIAVPALAQRPVEIPESTHHSTADRGVRAHTTHLILLRPERIQQARSTPRVGETPGSLACVYEISAASLGTGCPISGQLAGGDNGLPNAIGGSQIIALVDAYDYPTAYNDLTIFSEQFGLPLLPRCSESVTTSCFEQLYASGSKPTSNGSWGLEEALDIEWAHAMAPQASIVLVEATSDSLANLFSAVAVASQFVISNAGKGEVSMSWGSDEFSGEAFYDGYMQTAGVVYFAAAGDTGGEVIYPSASPYVVSAGGTSVNRNASGGFESETTWSDGGGGASLVEPVPAYQQPVVNLVKTKRGTPDLAFDANPNTGVFVYDSTRYDGSAGWWLVGGTSVASPALAGIANLARSFAPSTADQLSLIYGICGTGRSTACTATNYRDITSGSSGRNRAAIGWDFTTGVGSSLGTAGH